jgi:hypothetical protein
LYIEGKKMKIWFVTSFMSVTEIAEFSNRNKLGPGEVVVIWAGHLYIMYYAEEPLA